MKDIIKEIELINELRANYLVAELGPIKAVDKIARAIQNIDTSRVARDMGDTGSAENALLKAKKLLLETIGIKNE